MRFTYAIIFLLAAAMAYAGPVESHHDQICSKHQPNPAVTCQRH